MNSAQLRVAYPELVTDPAQPECDWTATIAVPLPATFGTGGLWRFKFHPATRLAWEAWRIVAESFGYIMSDIGASGSVNCRHIRGTTATSLHAHGIALDSFPGPGDEMADALEAVRTNSGKQVFRVLHRSENPPSRNHHTEIVCARDDLATGIDPSTLPTGDTDMITPGSSPAVIRSLQLFLTRHGLYDGEIDGLWGDLTTAGVDAVHDALGQEIPDAVGSPDLADFAAIHHNHGRPYKGAGSVTGQPRPTPNTTFGKLHPPKGET